MCPNPGRVSRASAKRSGSKREGGKVCENLRQIQRMRKAGTSCITPLTLPRGVVDHADSTVHDTL